MTGGESSVSVGSRPDSDRPGERLSNEPHHPNPSSRTLGDNSDDAPCAAAKPEQPGKPGKPGKPAKLGEADDADSAGEAPTSRESSYGEEGTNKTMPHPKPDNAPSDNPGGDQPSIPDSPHTRG